MRTSATSYLGGGIAVAAIFGCLSVFESLCIPLGQLLSGILPSGGNGFFRFLPLIYWLAGFVCFFAVLPFAGKFIASFVDEDRFRLYCRANSWLFYVIATGFVVTALLASATVVCDVPRALPEAMFFYCLGLMLAYRKAFVLYDRVGIFKFFNRNKDPESSFISNRLHIVLLDACRRKVSVILENDHDENCFKSEFSGRADNADDVGDVETRAEKIAFLATELLYPDYVVCGSYQKGGESRKLEFEVMVFARDGSLVDSHKTECEMEQLENAYHRIADKVVTLLKKLPSR